MTGFVIDASIAVKWVVEETGTPAALRRKAKLADERFLRKIGHSQQRRLQDRVISLTEAAAGTKPPATKVRQRDA